MASGEGIAVVRASSGRFESKRIVLHSLPGLPMLDVGLAYRRDIRSPLVRNLLRIAHEVFAVHSPNPRFWQSSPLRYRYARNSAICTRENGERFGLGVRGSLPQSPLEDLRNRKEVGLQLRTHEVGYLTYGPDAANVLFHVVNHRHLRKRPMIFTTNKPLKPLSEWGKVLHDEDLAAAILDRVLERGRFVHLDGPSGRTRHLKEEVLPATAERARISGIRVPEFPELTTTHIMSLPTFSKLLLGWVGQGMAALPVLSRL